LQQSLFIFIFIRPAHHHGGPWDEMWLPWLHFPRRLPSTYICGTCEASMLHFHCHLKLIASYDRVDTLPVSLLLRG